MDELQKGYGLDAGDIEALAAADVFTADEIVSANHVALRLGEASLIAVVGTATELGFFAADEPGELVLALLPAVGTGHDMGLVFGPLVEEVALFHGYLLGVIDRVLIVTHLQCPSVESIAYWVD